MSRERQIYSFVVCFVVFVFGIEVVMFQQLDMTLGEQPSRSASAVMNVVTEVNALRESKYPDDDILTRMVLEPDREGLKNELVSLPDHLLPSIPILPLFNSIENANDYIASLMEGRPSMAGVIAYLQMFISELHKKNEERKKADGDGNMVLSNFFGLAEKYLEPFEHLYQGKNIFPLRSDDSIFISVAAFREPLLAQTLDSAFKHAKNPEKLFVGAIVQNCFGTVLEDGTIDTSGTPCKTGPKVLGIDENGKKIVDKEDKPPDANGIEVFCAMPEYEKYCKNGQVRVLYMHHMESLGPSMARYYASKLWGGETFVMQIDSHLHFAHHWDAKYVEDIKLTRSFPKSLLSTYPPGFDQYKFLPKHFRKKNPHFNVTAIDSDTVLESPGTRLCGCGIPKDGKDGIVHINQGRSYRGGELRPTQIPFLGAGFVFFRGDFFAEIPFDPYLPWTFMGEEILLSMRAWTHGWNLYAPRKNLILHEYRPGITGIPKFVGAVNENAKKGKNGFKNGWLQKRTLRRIKNICGYPLHTTELIEKDNQTFVLVDKENYGLGTVRTWEEFMEFSELKVNKTTGALDCRKGGIPWCTSGSKE